VGRIDTDDAHRYDDSTSLTVYFCERLDCPPGTLLAACKRQACSYENPYREHRALKGRIPVYDDKVPEMVIRTESLLSVGSLDGAKGTTSRSN
jgi:hypothetical protein